MNYCCRPTSSTSNNEHALNILHYFTNLHESSYTKLIIAVDPPETTCPGIGIDSVIPLAFYRAKKKIPYRKGSISFAESFFCVKQL